MRDESLRLPLASEHEQGEAAGGEEGDQLTDGLPIFLDSVRRSAVTPQDKEPFAEQKIVWFANDRDVIRGSRCWLLTDERTANAPHLRVLRRF